MNVITLYAQQNFKMILEGYSGGLCGGYGGRH